MSGFVEECRAEWDRLGVPEAATNEMAADLEADLAEAEADGASPEEVLGNGYFDAKSFAASWAHAKGVVNERQRTGIMQLRTRTVTFFSLAAVSLMLGVIGLLLFAGRRFGSASASAVAIRHSLPRPVPSIFVHHTFGAPGIALDVVGLVLLGIGIVGLGITLWLWRPWSMKMYRSDRDPNVGLPSYL
jgi:hypothetical protein